MLSVSSRISVLSRLSCTKMCSAQFSTPRLEFKDEIKDQMEKLVVRKPYEPKKGKVQTWKDPIYYSPHQHVFEQSPDFSFKDGRTVHVTSEKQLSYKLDQIRLAKKIVSLLNENDEVEKEYKRVVETREKREKEEKAKRPKKKGNESIC